VSFAGLATLVRRATDALVRLGVRRGDRVVLCTRNRMELAVAEWAVVRAGAVGVPVGARLPPDQILRIVAAPAARRLVAPARVLRNPLGGSALPGLGRIVADAAGDADVLGLPELVAAARDDVPPAAAAADDLALVFYTSGTTGQSKGVMLTHGNVMFATRNA